MKLLRKKDKKIEEKIKLAIDIGTENVKCVLYRIDEGEVSVLGYSRANQKPFSMSKAIIMDSKEVSTTVDKCIGLALMNAEEKFTDITIPRTAIVGIAGELVSGVPIVVNVERDDPEEKITESEIQNVISKVREHTFQSTKEEIAEEIGMETNQLQEIETSVTSIYIDGIKIKDPVSHTGSEITYRVFSSFAPRIQLDSINKICKAVKLDSCNIVVEPFALAKSIEFILNDPNGGIIIDIGAGTTDVTVVQNGEIMGVSMFAIGGRVFSKRLEKELGIDYKEAEDLKMKYSLNQLDDFRKRTINKSLKNDIKAWLLGVELSLEEMNEVNEYPANIYLCGGGSYLPDIKDGLMQHPWIQRLNFKKHPKVNLLLPNKIERVNDLTRSLTEPIDVMPLCLAKMTI